MLAKWTVGLGPALEEPFEHNVFVLASGFLSDGEQKHNILCVCNDKRPLLSMMYVCLCVQYSVHHMHALHWPDHDSQCQASSYNKEVGCIGKWKQFM